jgi:hypothetical protein
MKVIAFLSLLSPWVGNSFGKSAPPDISAKQDETVKSKTARGALNIGTEKDGISDVFIAQGEAADSNMLKLIEMLGGVQRIVGLNDIVVLKPNAQWWSQGMTNTDAMKAFIEAVLKMPGFKGEIIVAENHHDKGLNSRGWTTENRNGRFNYNELIDHFQRGGFPNVTKYCWQDAGINPRPLEGTDCCGKKVAGPEEGDGYVWCDDVVYTAPNGNICWMTYPVFSSPYSGIRVDLKNGAWKDGKYLDERPVKFINFSAINHHGLYSGVTASIKNLMGVVDMTCGFQAPEPKGTFNVHFVGVEPLIKFSYWTRRDWGLGFAKDWLRRTAYTNFHFTGGALGKFMTSIRMPDLNIITADWVGWGSRTDTTKSAKPRAILASRDPVALDFIAARDVLLKATPHNEETYRMLNDPTRPDGPFHKFIRECHLQGIGNLDPGRIRVNRTDIQQA